MAIAAGINVPEVFVLDNEPGVNALAAGHTPNEAVVIVTRGALDGLSRDELQGMMAHEFSHILNGDIRLNMRVLGVISGITLLGGIGRAYIHTIFFAGAAPLWVIGLAGMYSGRVIRAALSRQGEFLADAAAVQFTRDPSGIARGLLKMMRKGAEVTERHSEELEHMYLGEPRRRRFGWLSSHPPTEERLERILGPRWRHILNEQTRGEEAIAAARRAPAAPAPPAAMRTSVDTLMSSIGHPSNAQLLFARQLLARLPESLHDAAGTETGASSALLALLLAEPETRTARLAAIRARAGEERASEALRDAEALDGLDPRLRVPLFELAVPALKEATPAVRAALLDTALSTIAAGGRASLHDFVLLTLCRRHLGAHGPGPVPEKYLSLVPVTAHIVAVISLLVHASRAGEGVFHRAMTALGFAGLQMVPAADLGYVRIEQALYELKLLAARRREQFVQACLGVVIADQSISVREGELMRAICAAIDSPLPPIVAAEAG
jgi:predicted Zn-dependent protease